MTKKPVRYIRYCYCFACKGEFTLSNEDKKACVFCQGENSFVLLSKKRETERGIIEIFKKDISITKKIIQQDYLEGVYNKGEREDLDRLRELKYMEDFLNKNPNLSTEDVLKMINKK